MLTYINFITIILCVLLDTSCDEENITTPNVEGKWDLQIEYSGDILWHYEQGFELLSSGKYLPRYWNSEDSTWQSEDQKISTNTWELVNINGENRLYFHNEYTNFMNETRKSTVFYLIKSIEGNSMQLVGINAEGHKKELEMFKEE